MVSPQRLRQSRDILATMRSRRRCVGDVVVTHARQNDGHPDSVQFAVVASKKVGSAVSRNRAKRLLRAAARQVPWTPGVDVVLVARAATVTASLDAVTSELAGHARTLAIGGGQ